MASTAQPSNERLLTPREAAARLATNTATLRRWAEAGDITAILLPSGQARYKEKEIVAIAAGQLSPKDRSRGDER